MWADQRHLVSEIEHSMVTQITTMTDSENLAYSGTPEQNRTSEEVEYLKLNVGGRSFCLSSRSVEISGEIGLLFNFVTSHHEQRVRYCDDFNEKTQQYFFERAPHMFEPIYEFYVTGMPYIPHTIPQEIFAVELNYWGLTSIFLPNFADISKPLDNEVAEPDLGFNQAKFGWIRKKIWDFLETPESSLFAKLFALTSIMAVMVSNLGLILGSMPSLQVRRVQNISDGYNGTLTLIFYHQMPILDWIEIVCIGFFTVEYLLRMLVAVNRSQVMFKFMNITDLVAILPFYLELSMPLLGMDSDQLSDVQGALLVVRILRVLRVIRLFKLGRYSSGLRMFAEVVRCSLPQLGMVAAVVAIGVMFFSTLVYYTEKDCDGTAFVSIPVSAWWCIVTMATVGYGDMFPQTIGGKLIAGCAMACGVLVLSLPITIIVDNFIQVRNEFMARRQNSRRAPL